MGPWGYLKKGYDLRDEHLRRALGYRKFIGAPRVLFIDTGYLVIGDAMEAAEDIGWTVTRLPLRGKGVAENESIASLLTAIALNKPDFVLTINHLGFDEGGVIAKLLSQYGVLTASWFVDHPLPILGGSKDNAVETLKIFCFERTALDWLEKQGYHEPVYLPTGANRRYFHPDKVDKKRREALACPLSFAGNSWWTKARVEPAPLLKKAASKLSKGRVVDKTILLDGFEKRLAQKVPGPVRQRYAAAQIMLAEASMQKRQRFAQALMPLGIRIFGDPYWEKMAKGIDRVSFVDNHTGLPALFSGSAVNANVTAVQMPTAVNQRVWDVPAVGGLLLTDDQEDARIHFEADKEIVLYSDFEEAKEKAQYYLKHEDLCKTIGQRALERVDREHDMTKRMGVIAETMRRAFG